MVNIWRAVEVLPDAVADKHGHYIEPMLLGVLENPGANVSKRSAWPASFDPDV